jgi:hypothetical protein
MAKAVDRIVARSRDEAIRLGLNTWTVKKLKPPRTLVDIDADIARERAQIDHIEARTKAITGGYMQPPESETFLVTAHCGQVCVWAETTSCTSACESRHHVARAMIEGAERHLCDLATERRAFLRRSRRKASNVISLADYR